MNRKRLGRILVLGSILGICVLGGCARQTAPPVKLLWTEPTEETQAKPAPLSFPVTFSDSALIAEELMAYKGPYWEDGTGDAVENVAGLMLQNPTDRMIDFGAFSVEQAGQTLYFFVYRMPPQSRCLILEYTKKPWVDADATDCRELGIRWDHQEFSREQLDYLGFGHRLTVINRDCRTQNHVTLWYKQYVKEEDYYLGGAAQSAHVFFLQPQEHRTVTPENYNAGNARIVAIRMES